MNGYGRRWRRWSRLATAPRGYNYVGPCRCGTGPHAFYEDAQGRVVTARQLFRRSDYAGITKDDLKTELEALKQEKAELEKEIQDLEKDISSEEK